jgi:RimJ/RimL family protein N-acetyltransferase
VAVTVRLRPFVRADFDRLIAQAESPEFLYQWSGPLFTFPLDHAQLERYLLTAVGDPPTTRLFTAVADAELPVGHLELTRIDRRQRAATLARVLVFAGHRGQGVGRAMVSQALRVGFAELGLHRIELFVFDFNRAAVRAYEHAGLTIEGHLRDVRRVGSQYWSAYQMSILEDEWRSRTHADQ